MNCGRSIVLLGTIEKCKHGLVDMGNGHVSVHDEISFIVTTTFKVGLNANPIHRIQMGSINLPLCIKTYYKPVEEIKKIIMEKRFKTKCRGFEPAIFRLW